MTKYESDRADNARRHRDRLAEVERRAGHADATERALLVIAIDIEIQRLEVMRHVVHAELGLVDRTIHEGRLSTPMLQAVLATLKLRERQP